MKDGLQNSTFISPFTSLLTHTSPYPNPIIILILTRQLRHDLEQTAHSCDLLVPVDHEGERVHVMGALDLLRRQGRDREGRLGEGGGQGRHGGVVRIIIVIVVTATSGCNR